MSALTVTAVPLRYRPTDVTLPETLFAASADDLTVDFEVSASALPLIADYIPEGTPLHEQDGYVRTSVRVAHYHGLKRLVAGLSGVLTVLAPEEARQALPDSSPARAA